MTNFNKQRSDRIDTTITEVAVRGGDDRSSDSTAVAYVRNRFPDEFASVLAVWMTGKRDRHGYPIYAVEWETKEEQ